MNERKKVAVLPFAAARIDDEQGVWSRQLAARMANELAALGADVTFAPLVAEGEEGPAFLHDEAYPESDTLARRFEGAEFDEVLAGELRIDARVARLGAALHETRGDRHRAEFMQERPAAEVFELLEDAIRHFGEALGVKAHHRPALLRQTDSVRALRLFLADQDVALHESMMGPRPGARLAERWRFLREAAATDPQFMHAQGLYVQRAISAARAGEFEEAVEAMDALDAALGEADADRLGARAEVCVAAKRFDDAEEALTEALALRPDFAWARYRLGYFRLLVDDFEGAVSHLRRGYESEPTNPHIRGYLAVALAELGEMSEAEALWESVRVDPAAPAMLRDMASASSRFAEARAELDRAADAEGEGSGA